MQFHTEIWYTMWREVEKGSTYYNKDKQKRTKTMKDNNKALAIGIWATAVYMAVSAAVVISPLIYIASAA